MSVQIPLTLFGRSLLLDIILLALFFVLITISIVTVMFLLKLRVGGSRNGKTGKSAMEEEAEDEEEPEETVSEYLASIKDAGLALGKKVSSRVKDSIQHAEKPRNPDENAEPEKLAANKEKREQTIVPVKEKESTVPVRNSGMQRNREEIGRAHV